MSDDKKILLRDIWRWRAERRIKTKLLHEYVTKLNCSSGNYFHVANKSLSADINHAVGEAEAIMNEADFVWFYAIRLAYGMMGMTWSCDGDVCELGNGDVYGDKPKTS